jgi:putative hydrolase of the HAD superfamily
LPAGSRYAADVALSHLLFDLDNTLYAPTCGIVERVHALITAFMVARLGMTAAEADALRARYREELGTTLNGLMRDHAVSPDEYLAWVHAIDIEELLGPDAALLAMLRALPHEKLVFTNGSSAHAERILACLGVRECFVDVYSLERVAYVPKPQRAAFESVLRALAVPAAHCLLIDDRVDNLRTAGALGMHTLLVGDAEVPTGVEAAVPSVLELPAVLRTMEAA